MTVPSFEALYTAYRERVLAYLTGRTENRKDAEDLCAEVFAEVLRCLPRYDAQKASISTWIYHITRNTLIDYLRTRRRYEPLSEDLPAEDDLEGGYIRQETLALLADALDALEREERDVIVLRYFRKMTLREISRLNGVSYGIIKLRHGRALKTLRALIEQGRLQNL